MIRDVSPDEWRQDPHVIVEAALCMADEKEPGTWQRCALTSDLRFEPPLVTFSPYQMTTEDRTLFVRTPGGVNLVTPDLVRINKLRYTSMPLLHSDVNCRLEVLQQIDGPLYKDRYASERAALADLVRNIESLSHKAARTIQRAWKRAISNPEYSVCRGRLLEEFAEVDVELR
jgi:hypothetical protein